jgi:hypothetical protein
MVGRKKRIIDWLLPIIAIFGTFALGATVRIPMSLHSFNSGELSPLMNARSDYPKYPSGAKTLTNMLVRSQGPVERRPGTKYIAEVKDATDTIRLIPFEYSTSDAYVIEMGDSYARFYRAGAQIQAGGGGAYEIVTPWDSNDLFELQFTQDAQFLRLVHPDYQPYKMTRTAHAAWTCTAIEFTNGPFENENETTTTTITASALTGTVTLTGSAAIWNSDHVGALWQISHIVDSNNVDKTWVLNWTTGNNTPTDALFVYKDQYLDFSTAGAWNGTVRLQRSYDSKVTWEDVTTYSSRNDGNLQWSGQETFADCYYRAILDGDYTITDRSYCIINLQTRSYKRAAVVEISAFSSSTSVTAITETDIYSTDATYMWAEGSWSDDNGWPRTVEHYEQRCIYGGSELYPQTVWASIVATEDADYDDFNAGTSLDAEAYTYVLPGMNPIQWLRGQEFLMIGTTGGVGRFGMTDEPTTPTNVEYRLQAYTGSDYIQAVHAVDSVLFVERGGQKIREVSFSPATERYIADDVTVLAEHITDTGVTEIDFMYRPDPILWCVRDDGVLLSFTYNKRHEIAAWAKQTASGTTFDSVAVIPGSTEDVVYTVASRTIDSNSVSYVENFAPLDWTADQNDAYFCDSAVTDGNSLSHLEGEEVVILNDARPGTPETVASGAITASGYANYVIGLPYTSVYESMPLVAASGKGTSALLKTGVINVKLDLYNTLTMNLGYDADNTSAIEFSEDAWATTIDAFTGIKTASFPRGISRDRSIYIDANEPVPMTIRGIHADLEVITD